MIINVVTGWECISLCIHVWTYAMLYHLHRLLLNSQGKRLVESSKKAKVVQSIYGYTHTLTNACTHSVASANFGLWHCERKVVRWFLSKSSITWVFFYLRIVFSLMNKLPIRSFLIGEFYYKIRFKLLSGLSGSVVAIVLNSGATKTLAYFQHSPKRGIPNLNRPGQLQWKQCRQQTTLAQTLSPNASAIILLCYRGCGHKAALQSLGTSTRLKLLSNGTDK